jgi:solute:Na+ symporter, SSS family
MQTGVIVSLALYFILMLAIGVYAWRKTAADTEGYLLAGRDLSPSVTALSAGASDMSGWLLLGLPGALYASGLIEAWIAIGLFVGALVNWIVVAPRLRRQTEALGDALTIPEFLGNRFPDKAVALRLTSAVIVVVFFTVYTAAGMVGGGKLFEMAFDGNYMTGIYVTAGVVLVYTMIGGFLAVSLTDFVQGVIMFAALIIMPLVIVFGSGEALSTVPQEGFLSLTNGLTAVGWLSAVTWGLGYFGQPHIIVRFMAIRSADEIPVARNIAMAWMGVCLLGAIGVGLAGRAYVQGNGIALEDPETVFILLANLLFHPLVTGFLYAALLAAIMSTISSQLLVSSSSLTEDFYRLFLRKQAGEREAVMVGRLSVLLVALMGIAIAADRDSQVLGLVAHAWAGFGAAFGPMIVLALTWKRMTGAGAVAGLVVGAAVVIGWVGLGWDESFLGGPGLYEILPGFVASWMAIVLVSKGTSENAAPAPTMH